MMAAMTYEAMVKRLDDILEIFENGDTPLAEKMVLYKEAMELLAQASEMLSQYESEITVLQRKADGLFSLQPMSNVE